MDSLFHGFYVFGLAYIGIYPLFGGALWITTAIIYWFHRERRRSELRLDHYPMVSIIISARNEEKTVGETLKSLLRIDYPAFEIIVVDDNSTDTTPAILQKYSDEHGIRVIRKHVNQGKAMAINDAVLCANGEIFMIVDADAQAEPDVLRRLIPHFKRPRVAAVSGNPRVKNVPNFLTRMQLIEYTAVIGMIRRSQRIWGRILSVSGVVFAVRKSAFFEVGGFSPAAATEDMDLTWKLQRNFWDVLYESSAIVWVHVPTTYKDFFRQRLRWGRGLMHSLRQYSDIITKWKHRRMWPVFIENVLSSVWAFFFVFFSVFWIITSLLHTNVYGLSIIPITWGTVLSTLMILIASVGILLDKKYDPKIMHYFPYVIFYPIYYWIVLAVISVCSLPAFFIKPKIASIWRSPKR